MLWRPTDLSDYGRRNHVKNNKFQTGLVFSPCSPLAMQLVLDQGVPREAAAHLLGAGHVGEIGISQAAEEQILAFSRERTAVVHTPIIADCSCRRQEIRTDRRRSGRSGFAAGCKRVYYS